MRFGGDDGHAMGLLRAAVRCASYVRSPRPPAPRPPSKGMPTWRTRRDRPARRAPGQARHSASGLESSTRRPRTAGQGGGRPELERQLARLTELQDRLWAEGEALGAHRAAGHRCGRQGRHHQEGHGGVQPAGLPGHGVQGADAPRSSPTTTCGGSTRRCRARARSASSTARTTRTCWSCASTTSCRRRSGARATTRSTPSSSTSARQRHDDRQVLPVHRPRRAAGRGSRRATTTRPSAGSSRWATSPSASAGTTTRPPSTTPCSKTSTDAAPWYVIPADRKWFRNLAVATILADTMAGLKPKYPPVADDVPAALTIV